MIDIWFLNLIAFNVLPSMRRLSSMAGRVSKERAITCFYTLLMSEMKLKMIQIQDNWNKLFNYSHCSHVVCLVTRTFLFSEVRLHVSQYSGKISSDSNLLFWREWMNQSTMLKNTHDFRLRSVAMVTFCEANL